MKLAEALQERADINIKLSNLSGRLTANCVVQEGERPAEKPAELLNEYAECSKRLEYLIAAINKTNCVTKIGESTITELLAKKDVLAVKLSVYRNLITSASQTAKRARHTEIKILSTVDVRELQKTADLMAKELRQLDNSIQAANWQTDLIE